MSAVQTLFSEAVIAVETRADDIDESLLWPEERDALGEVVAGRRWDWVMGRRCARMAIDALGVDAAPILSGDKREPLWPAGVVGAITHTQGYAAAAVARTADLRALGVDAEPDEPLPTGVLRRVAVEAEHGWLGGDVGGGVVNPDRLLFTIKESIYKTWYPLAQRWLGFEDACVAIDASRQEFEAQILIDGPLQVVRGRYASVDRIVMAAVEH